MSQEQASVYKKHRFARDVGGDQAWSQRLTQRALRASPGAAARDIEAEFELIDLDRVVWRILQLPRRFSDLERASLMSAPELLAVLRGFVAADVVDVIDDSEARALLPAEVKRTRAEVAGKEWRTSTGSLTGKVYRPDIGISSEGAATGSQEGVPVEQQRSPTSPGMPAFQPPRSATGAATSGVGMPPRTGTIPGAAGVGTPPRTATAPGTAGVGMPPRTATMPGTAGVGMPPRTATGSAMTGVAGIGTPRTSSSPGMQAPAFGAPRAVTDPGMAAVGAPRSASGPAVAAPGFAAPRTASGAMGGVGVARAGTNPGMPAVPFAYSRALLPAEKTMKAQIEQSHAKLAQIDHYAFLGVPQTADDAAIRAAYVTLAREYHPDRLAGSPLAEDPTLREQIESLFKRLGEAQKTLTNAESRARYDRDLKAIASSGGPTTGPNARPRRPTEARTAFVMAETFFKKKEYGQAELHYRQAANFDPEEPMIIVALAWCIFLNPDHPLETRRDDARRRLEEALKKFKSGEAAYRLGRVMRELGDEAAALKLFQIAAKLTPNHVDANRELRIVEMRRGKGDADGDDDKEKKGLIDKLFKR